jgi:hypothetical protein
MPQSRIPHSASDHDRKHAMIIVPLEWKIREVEYLVGAQNDSLRKILQHVYKATIFTDAHHRANVTKVRVRDEAGDSD